MASLSRFPGRDADLARAKLAESFPRRWCGHCDSDARMRAFVLGTLVAFAFALVASSTAHAQPGMVEPQPPRASPKSTAAAVSLALGTTAAGVVMLAIGANMEKNCFGTCTGADTLERFGALAVVVGPSLGHVYAGHTWNAGLGIRLAGMAALGVGVIAMLPCYVTASVPAGTGNYSNGNSSATCEIGKAALLLGATATVVGTLTEIVTSASAVSDYNDAHSLPAITVTPIRTVSGVAPGLSFVGRF
jgi:hypothetical protein